MITKLNLKFFSFIIIGLIAFGPSFAHSINNCLCEDGCYTEEVSQLVCKKDRAEFKSIGLPDENHDLMIGIEASNQQFPSVHNYQFTIKRNPTYLKSTTQTDSGPIGVAINGVPLFDPSTQGRADSNGNRPHTLDAGELDNCGGHSGRGDDYHYHIAPKCLIKDLGIEHIETLKQPIGFAMDGFPILALGWFKKSNDVESMLDDCRGMTDENGQYFYNVMSTKKWDIVNCLHGKPQKFSKDKWTQRKDKNGRDIIGVPIKFNISRYKSINTNGDMCHIISGDLKKEQVLRANGTTAIVSNTKGDIFHCNNKCYGLFFEAAKKPEYKGRVMFYDLVTDGCPSDFSVTGLKPFDAYTGPPVAYNGAASTNK